MKIKLKTGFCEVRECDLVIERQSLHLTGPGLGKKIRIDFRELKRFSLDNSRPGPPSFQLDTGTALYQGRFLRQEDSSLLIEHLERAGKSHIEILFQE